jgi:hypothetical protein
MLETLHLKQETTLFEWARSIYFQDILTIISKLVNNEDIEIYEDKIYTNNISIDNTNIFTSHYKKHQYVEIFKRRSQRFIEYIKTSDNIIFIREDYRPEPTTLEQILKFKDLIYKINPLCKFKFLLLSIVSIDNIINIPGLYHFIHSNDKDIYKSYIEQLDKSGTFM